MYIYDETCNQPALRPWDDRLVQSQYCGEPVDRWSVDRQPSLSHFFADRAFSWVPFSDLSTLLGKQEQDCNPVAQRLGREVTCPWKQCF